MFCEKCNIEFPEGLRYCKWCGQTLVERQRVTSELNKCPSCEASIEASWAFCKICGAKLGAEESEPIRPVCPRCGAATAPGALNCVRCGEDLTGRRESGRIAADASTAIFVQCPSCGDPVDPGAIYCKGCGTAVYSGPAPGAQPEQPFGASSLLCRVCNSYSPIGSTACRICGASLLEPQRGPGESAPRTLSDVEDKPGTLPDLPEHLGSVKQPDHLGGTVEMSSLPSRESAASDETKVFGKPDSFSTSLTSTKAPHTVEHEAIDYNEPKKKTAETSVLPGVAGSRAEHQTPTSIIHPRITGPVDPEEEQGHEAGESEPVESRPIESKPVESKPADASPVTRVSTPIDPAKFNQPAADSSGTINLGSRNDVRESQWQAPPPPSSSTVMMGSIAPTAKPDRDDQTIELGQRTEAPRPAHHDVTAPFALDQQPGETRMGVNYQPPPIEQPIEQPPPPEMRGTRDISVSPTGGIGAPVTGAPITGRPEWEEAAAAISAPVDMHAAATHPAPAERKGIAGIISVMVGILVIGAAIFVAWWFLVGGKKTGPQTTTNNTTESQPSTSPAQTTAPTPAPSPATPVAPEGMVFVPGGTYTIGRDQGDPLEGPQHSIELSPFFIDRTEVTNADYKRFVDATGHKPPDGWKDGKYTAGTDNWPVTGVTWQDAVDFAAWAGKRLPTEAEWEAAARGSDGRLYPWGNQWRTGVANISTSGMADVGKYKDSASPVGALDMIGNVWEWTADEFTLYPGTKASMPASIEPGVNFRIFRGGAYDGDKKHTVAYRGFLDAGKPYPKIGFRCAKDAR